MAIDETNASGEFWDYLSASKFICGSELLEDLKRELKIERGSDPLSTMLRLNSIIYETFDYAPQTTSVDSPIDHALSGSLTAV